MNFSSAKYCWHTWKKEKSVYFTLYYLIKIQSNSLTIPARSIDILDSMQNRNKYCTRSDSDLRSRVILYEKFFSSEYFKEFKLDHESECNDFLLHRLIFKLSLLLCYISTDLDYLIIIQNGEKDMSLMNLQYFRG